MTELLPIVIGALFWAWMTEKSTCGTYGITKQTGSNRFAFFMLVLTLALPITLRLNYNDTWAYISTFNNAQPINALISSGTLHILKNPLFYVYQSLVRTFTDNYMIFFMFPAFFVQYSYMRFIRRHSNSLLIGVGLYFFLGSYTFSIAAMKQVFAMAILLYAVDALIERKHIRFCLLVFLAFLFHTYAIMFLILPLFTSRPWSAQNFLLLLCVVFVAANFESVLTSFLEFANESGKNVAEEEVIGATAINPIRVAVYAVPPLFALIFRRQLFSNDQDREHNLLVNMSFISASIMAIGLVNAANMFGRMAQYFEFGIICGLPWMLAQPFTRRSERFVTAVAIVCFAGYFAYANLIQFYFDDVFARHTVLQFIELLFRR